MGKIELSLRQENGANFSPSTVSHIGPDQFLLPDRADRFARPLNTSDEVALKDISSFARLQTEAANNAFNYLSTRIPSVTKDDWTALYISLINWRTNSGIPPLDARCRDTSLGLNRLALPITDESRNFDRLRPNGQLRPYAVWDEQNEVWRGGVDTPASLVLERAADYAQAHFTDEGETGDVLHTRITLPDGQITRGNRLIRGDQAKSLSLMFKSRLMEQGHDVSNFELHDTIFAVSADQADREIIFDAAITELSSMNPGHNDLARFVNLAYLFFQAPLTKRGSDAVIRTFLTTAGTFLFKRPITLPQDIDLRAYTAGQEKFVQEIASEIEILSSQIPLRLTRNHTSPQQVSWEPAL